MRWEKRNPVWLTVLSLVPDLLFDCSRELQYAKIRTVLQSRWYYTLVVDLIGQLRRDVIGRLSVRH